MLDKWTNGEEVQIVSWIVIGEGWVYLGVEEVVVGQ